MLLLVVLLLLYLPHQHPIDELQKEVDRNNEDRDDLIQDEAKVALTENRLVLLHRQREVSRSAMGRCAARLLRLLLGCGCGCTWSVFCQTLITIMNARFATMSARETPHVLHCRHHLSIGPNSRLLLFGVGW